MGGLLYLVQREGDWGPPACHRIWQKGAQIPMTRLDLPVHQNTTIFELVRAFERVLSCSQKTFTMTVQTV